MERIRSRHRLGRKAHNRGFMLARIIQTWHNKGAPGCV